jgi:D-alanyl-D-alanine carboxypeptidase
MWKNVNAFAQAFAKSSGILYIIDMRFFCLFLSVLFLSACFPLKSGKKEPTAVIFPVNNEVNGEDSLIVTNRDTELAEKFVTVMRNAELPDTLINSIHLSLTENSAFLADLQICLKIDQHLWELVDKQHPLSPDYTPSDLVVLANGEYLVNREGMMLREVAARSLNEMAAAARADGVVLVASSAYRSYSYQEEVYNRNVRELGREEADRESARPGHSQHQTGLVVDFGSIDDSFALTGAGRWILANASRFGWSLSFPNGYEAITGYRWESWHYRYVGRELAAFIDNYFGGIQQYSLRFLHEYALAAGQGLVP